MTTIAELLPDTDVDGVYACTKKQKLTTRGGSPYLSVELRDATGKIPGRAFRDASFLDAQFDRGDIVRVAGRVESFQDQHQINLRSIKRAEENEAGDPSDYLPSAYRDIDELEGFFEHLAGEVHDEGYRRVLRAFWGDKPLRQAFRTAPCTIGGHHAYLGGLLEHTVAVATLARETQDLHRRLDSDLLIAAALVHDIGKVREFSYGAEISQTEEGRLLGHVELGAQIIRDLVRAAGGIEPERELALLNCVLSHHGVPGGGNNFASAEALALYRINSLDANVKGYLE
ncbi:MAG: HD domain-containing protein [Solirubrobacterales bacterium]